MRKELCKENIRWRPINRKRHFVPESQVLRLCHRIHDEALPILYGENIYRYHAKVSIYNDLDYIKKGFPDQNLHLIRHLIVKVRREDDHEAITPDSLVFMIDYFRTRGCKLKTFTLAFFGPRYDDSEEEELYPPMIRSIAQSAKLVECVLALDVREKLTVSVQDHVDENPRDLVRSMVGEMMNRLKTWTLAVEEEEVRRFSGRVDKRLTLHMTPT